jgi:1-acyl-sn-glycerol-3-phosphate acyltransferase
MFVAKTLGDYTFEKHSRRLIRLFTGLDQIVFIGLDNLVKEGPNIVTANHPGIGKDVAVIDKLYLEKADRRLHFTARKELFSVEGFKYLVDKEFTKNLPLRMLRYALKPLELALREYIPDKLNKTEIIAVDIENNGSSQARKFNMDAYNTMKDYLNVGRVVVLFQYNKNKTSSPYHHYLQRFHTTPARIAADLYSESGMKIPITPISIHGAEGILPFRRIIVNIGAPAYITDYLSEQSPVKSMTDALEQKIASLLIASGLEDDKKKHFFDPIRYRRRPGQ